MADLREELRPLVDRPVARPLAVEEVASRARRRRTRRRARIGALAGGALAAVALVAVLSIDREPVGVTTFEPAATTSSTTTTTAVPTTTATAAATTTTTTAAPPADDVTTAVTITSSWESGRCVEIRVDNPTGAAITWSVRHDPEGTVTDVWNAVPDPDGVTFRGESWNARLAPGAWTTFGLCISTA